jgi:Peptidase family M50
MCPARSALVSGGRGGLVGRPAGRALRPRRCQWLRVSAHRNEKDDHDKFIDADSHRQEVAGVSRQPDPPNAANVRNPFLRFAAPAALLAFFPGILPDLSGPSSVVEAVLILCGIVAFHELGHFTAARVQGIHVSQFAIGFGPKLLSFKPGNVEYSLRALPLGGYVAFPDNDEDCPYPEDDPDLLKNRPLLDRFWVISAGRIPGYWGVLKPVHWQ